MIHSIKEEESVIVTLKEIVRILMESTVSEQDVSNKLSRVTDVVGRLDEAQLRQIWQRISEPAADENVTVRFETLIRIDDVKLAIQHDGPQGLVCRLRRFLCKFIVRRFHLGSY